MKEVQLHLLHYWLAIEIAEAKVIQAELYRDAVTTDYSNYEGEISRHEQDGWVNALEYLQNRALEEKPFTS